MNDIPLKCRCGQVSGIATGLKQKNSNRAVCHCADCQAFARHLGGEALDHLGGTDLIQFSPARLSFSSGQDQVACLRLTDKGLFRWYARCCNTPIGNTMPTPALPFVGIIHSFFDLSDDEYVIIFGPVTGHVFTKAATGDPQEVSMLKKAGPGDWLKLVSLLLSWKMKGDSKRHAFFDSSTGKPIVTAHVLDNGQT
ncbi:DUF6151 family protein [Parvularcula sp. IMCC14364]|uniref:DUF6151 family protein n=1 Tax=Parvularcula sp. IMCC14364 TaxID=3067902 RepID=UPI002740AA68|nr:DUF6151 family protein [Parvularcula sp. IMCC14364]